ncbi:Efflux pump radE [Vanrija pseudolonga]|uniref:Efflux pump radE n=1 Tax=Vanrija pseudolonga TaxID=143232 RepID=A0AAF0Y811_9TREE|nr:Efflux pump radE [Vanrija pseudolonga]
MGHPARDTDSPSTDTASMSSATTLCTRRVDTEKDKDVEAGAVLTPPTPSSPPTPKAEERTPDGAIIVDWDENDPENPLHWPAWRKYMTVGVVVFITALTAMNATSVGIMATWGVQWFDTTYTGFELSLTMYLGALSITPLILAPMSELFGRNAIYQVTSVITALLFIPQALSRSLPGLLATRWFQGMASAVGNSMVGGTIADLFNARDRGLPMSLFVFFTFVGQSGGACFGWIGQRAGIQWCYGVQGVAAGVSVLINIVCLRETRADVLLARKAARLTKQTGVPHVARSFGPKKSMLEMLTITAIRPLKYLVTEPIVTSLTLWIAFNWGCIFLGTSSTLLVFAQYGWSPGLLGMVLLTTLVGGVLGFVTNYHQEYLYRRATARSATGRAAPEVRLYWAAAGGLIFPLSMYGFAWTGRASISWGVPAMFLSLALWGVYMINYLADAYETFSSSAQASHSFVRNLFAATFPLFAHTMYKNLGYEIASTVVASVSLALAAAPCLLIVYGPALRKRSKVASALAEHY